MRRGDTISTSWLDAPLAVPVLHLTAEPALSEGCDDESALAEGGIAPGVAVPAQGDQPVEVEVRAPLSALGDMVHVQASPDAAGLTGPAGAGQDLSPDLAPGLKAR